MQERKRFSGALLASNFSSIFGDGLYKFALNWFLVVSFGNAQLLGWLTGFGFIVFLISDVFVGAVLDNYNKKWVLLVCDLFGGLGLLVLAWFLNPVTPQLWLLFAVALIVNADLAFAEPAGRALLPEVIHRDAIRSFNGLLSAAFALGQALGPLAAGLLLQIKWIDLRTFLLIYGVMLLITTVINAQIHYVPAPKEAQSEPFFQSLKTGLRYVYGHPILLQSMLLTLWGNLFFEGYAVALPFLAQQTYAVNSATYAGYLTLAAVMAFGASLLVARLPKWNNINSMYWDNYVIGAFFVVSFLVPKSWILPLLIATYGFYKALFGIKINTVRQEHSDAQYLGRVYGMAYFATDLLAPVATVLIGYGASAVNRAITPLLGFVLVVGTLFLQMRIHQKSA
ncbi:MAG TPA: MFS transporter [Lactobacillaceae bacterium]|jgi:MFS family permease